MSFSSYMAPELAAGGAKSAGPAIDVYALGAILYECLTGRPPFRGATRQETLDQVRSLEPVPPRVLRPGLPRDLETIALKCLQKEPARRYARAAALADDLDLFLAGRPIVGRPVTRTERVVRWVRRRPTIAASRNGNLNGGGRQVAFWGLRRRAGREDAGGRPASSARLSTSAVPCRCTVPRAGEGRSPRRATGTHAGPWPGRPSVKPGGR